MATKTPHKSDKFIPKLLGLILAFAGLLAATIYFIPKVDPNLQKVIFVAVTPVLIYLLLEIATIIYVRANYKNLYEKNQQICDKCIATNNYISENVSEFRALIKHYGLNRTIKCANSTIANAKEDETKYVLKYSDLEYDKDCLEKLDFLREFQEKCESFDGKISECTKNIMAKIPLILKPFVNKKKVAYNVCGLPYNAAKVKCPYMEFLYESPSKKITDSFRSKIDAELLGLISDAISNKIEKQGHTKIQRDAMTNDLREAIKKRDDYTCQICGNSVYEEPNLLLEVDHIIPIAKGGKTEASNLQTLCWCCNREKSDN